MTKSLCVEIRWSAIVALHCERVRILALYQKVILHSRVGDKSKIFRILPVKSYRGEVRALLSIKLCAR